MERANLRIMGIEEGEKIHVKSTEDIFNKIIEKIFYLKRYKKYTEPQIDWIRK